MVYSQIQWSQWHVFRLCFPTLSPPLTMHNPLLHLLKIQSIPKIPNSTFHESFTPKWMRMLNTLTITAAKITTIYDDFLSVNQLSNCQDLPIGIIPHKKSNLGWIPMVPCSSKEKVALLAPIMDGLPFSHTNPTT